MEQQVTALGYKHVVDLVCKPLDQFLLRAYSHPGLEHWAFLMVGQFGRGVFEFVTYLEKGGILATTQMGNANDEIYRDNFKTSKPGAPAAELLKLHQARLAHLSEFHGAPRKLDATPLGLARDLEYSFVSKEQPKPSKGRKLLVDFGDGKGEPEMGMLDYRRYYTADARELNPHMPKLLAAMDADMKKLGFVHMGDAVGTFLSSIVFRGYAKPGGDVFAYWHVLAALTDTALGNLEFVTRYEKGAVLTTSRTAMSKDEPKRKIFRNLDPKGTPEKLLALHEKRKGELTAKFGKTLPVKLEPKEVAVQAEGFIERTIG